MPRLLEYLPEVEQSMLRPAVIQITRQLMDLLAISSKTQILYTGPEEETYQPGSTVTPPEEENNRFDHDERLSIEVDQDFMLDGVLTRAYQQAEQLVVFRDPALQTSMKPIYAPVEITINFEYKATDQTAANRWRSRMRNRVGQGQIQHLHTIDYHYLIPLKFLTILDEVVKLREGIAGYGQNLLQYLESHLDPRATIMTDLADKRERWAIAETQQQVQGYFDFDGYPEKGTRSNQGDTVTIAFGYKLSFEVPVAGVLRWPLMIHQKVIKYYEPEKPYAPENMSRMFTLSGSHNWYFEQGNGPSAAPANWSIRRGVAIPGFDEFEETEATYRTFRLVTGMIALNPNASDQPLLNYGQLGPYAIDADVLRLIKKEAPYISQGSYYSIFTLSLYRNGRLVGGQPLRMDTEGQVWCDIELSLRDYHHIRLGVVYDLTLLQPGVIERVQEDGDGLIKIIDWIDPTLKDRDKLPGTVGDGYVPGKDIADVIDDIGKGIDGVSDEQTRKMKTVEILSIIAMKKEPQ